LRITPVTEHRNDNDFFTLDEIVNAIGPKASNGRPANISESNTISKRILTNNLNRTVYLVKKTESESWFSLFVPSGDDVGLSSRVA